VDILADRKIPVALQTESCNKFAGYWSPVCEIFDRNRVGYGRTAPTQNLCEVQKSSLGAVEGRLALGKKGPRLALMTTQL
jgi:hypothetical protein